MKEDLKPISNEERTKRLWELYHSVLDFLIDNFKNPDKETSAFLISSTISFLKMNGITLDNSPRHSEIVQGLEAMYDLPFTSNESAMLQKLRTE